MERTRESARERTKERKRAGEREREREERMYRNFESLHGNERK